MDTSSGEIYLVMLEDELDPNLNSSLIGLIFPWAFRPKLEARFSEYDKYDYGADQEEWTEDDYYSFYGATASESWMSRWSPKTNTDWHASTKSSVNSHSTQFNAGDLLPKDVNKDWFETDFSTAQVNVDDNNLVVTDRYIVGVNTVGQSLKNASYDLRAAPANPKFTVSPWQQSTIEPEFNLKNMMEFNIKQ